MRDFHCDPSLPDELFRDCETHVQAMQSMYEFFKWGAVLQTIAFVAGLFCITWAFVRLLKMRR